MLAFSTKKRLKPQQGSLFVVAVAEKGLAVFEAEELVASVAGSWVVPFLKNLGAGGGVNIFDPSCTC